MQKFVEPKSKNNASIKVTWTPHFSILEKFPSLSSYSSVNSPTLANDILKTWLFISHHIKSVTKGEKTVQRMILFLKIDDMERMFLMYATELVTREDIKMFLKVIPESTIPVATKPSLKMTDRTNRHMRRSSAQIESKEAWSRWNVIFDQINLYPIAYKYLLDTIEYNMLATQEQKKTKYWFYKSKNFKQFLPLKKKRSEGYIAFPPVKNDNIFEKLTVEKLQKMESNLNIWKDK